MAPEPAAGVGVEPEGGAGGDQGDPAQRPGVYVSKQHCARELDEVETIEDPDQDRDGEDRQSDAEQCPGLGLEGTGLR